jgi:hypothetical protein
VSAEHPAAFARDRLEAAVREYVKGGFPAHDIARLVSDIATELIGEKEWAESISPRRSA